MHVLKNTGDFPVACTTKRLLRYDVSVSHKKHMLKVVSIAKGSEIPLQQQNFSISFNYLSEYKIA